MKRNLILLLASVLIISACGQPGEQNVDTHKKEDDAHLGIKYSLTANTSKNERIDGISDNAELDNMYPFNEIKLSNVEKTDSRKTKITYSNEPEFKRDGSNGQVMVEIPKHYFKRYREDNHEYIEISEEMNEGFELDPAFIENGEELDAIYVSAYDGHAADEKLNSWSGVFPSEDISLTQFREYAKNNGEGFALLDFRTVAMLQRLFMVYFADRDSQQAVGEGKSQFIYQTFSAALAINNEDGNYIEVDTTSRPDRLFLVDDTVTVSDDLWEVHQRKITQVENIDDKKGITFEGDPVNITEGITKIYHTPQITGETDEMEEHSGSSKVFDTYGHDSVKMFHIENLWGNVWTLLDGVVLDNLEVWIGENIEDYDDDNYKDTYNKLSFTYPEQPMNTQDNNKEFEFYIKNLTYDESNLAYQLPLEIGTNQSDKHFSDPWYAYDEPRRVPTFGGGWDLSFRAGIFTTRFWQGPTFNNNLNGARLIYKDI